MNIRQAVLHNTGWKILTMLFTFVNNIIIVRLTGAETGAAFFYAIAVFTLVSTFLRFGLENGITYYASKYPGRTGSLAVFISGISAVQAIVAFVILRYFVKESAGYSSGWITVFVCANVMVYYLTAFYQVKRMYISLNVSAAVAGCLQTMVLLFFYYSGTGPLISWGMAKNINDALIIVLSAALLLQLIFLWVFFLLRNKNDFKQLQPEKGQAKALFSYSLINFAASVLFYLVMRADFYFIRQYCDAKTLGNYVQVAKIGQMALILPSMLGGVIFPYSVNADADFSKKIGFFCRALTLMFFTGLVGLLIFGRSFFIWLLGADFDLVYSGILASFTGVYCLAINFVFTSYFEGQNRQLVVLSAAIINLLLIIIGDTLLVPKYGYLAAAIVFSAANFTALLLLMIVFVKRTGMQMKELFLFKKEDLKMLRFK